MVFYDLNDTELDQLANDLIVSINPVRASNEDNMLFWQPCPVKDLEIPSYFGDPATCQKEKDIDLCFPDTLLSDILMAFGPEPMCDAVIKAHINTILLASVRAAIKFHPVKELSERRPGIFTRTDVHLSLEQVVTMPRLGDNNDNHYRCTAQCILWYGANRDLEANLVVEKTNGVLGDDIRRISTIMCTFLHSCL